MMRSAHSIWKKNFPPGVVDWSLALALALAGLFVRLPFLALVPPFWNSEIGEALDALEIALGHSLPLVLPSQPHLGPVAAYPLAVVLRLFGLNPFTPRLFVAVLGALGVAATFLLVRVTGGRLAALIAGALLATNAFHILINSHVFWTNSLTPLLTTLALTAWIVSAESMTVPRPLSRRGWLVLACLLSGLALQSHPSVWTLVPGGAIGVVIQPRARSNLRSAWTWLAPGAALFAYSNLILFNLLTGLHSLSVLRAKSYALPPARSLWLGFPDRLQDLVTEFLRVLASNLPPVVSFNPITFAWVLALAIALLLNLIKRRTLLGAPTISGVLLIAFSNTAYNVGYAERYIMLLLPIVLGMMGLAVEDTWQTLQARTLPRVGRMGTAGIGLSAIALLTLQPLPGLRDYYAQQVQSGQSNQAYFAWVELARQYRDSGEQVLLASELDQFQAALNGSGVGTTLAYLFRLNGMETRFAAETQWEPMVRGQPAASVSTSLARSGFEEGPRSLMVCVVEDRTQRRLIIFPARKGTCL